MTEQNLGIASKQSVLIVEDDEILATAIAETLDLQGLDTHIISDGHLALAAVQELRPALVLLDVSLPDMSGIEVCTRLKQDAETASIPIVFVTGRVRGTDRLRGMGAGAVAYLTKPISPTQLIELVDTLLGGSELAQPTPPALPASEDQLVIYARELKALYEQERAERAALEQAQARLDELNRLKAGFLSAVTHELLTPFAKIGLTLQVLQREIAYFAPEQQEPLDRLGHELSDLHRLINGVVKFAELVNKRRDPQPGYVVLDQVIPGTLQPLALLAQAREIDFRVRVPGDLPRVYADPELLGEAVFQMAHNAIKFNRPGGNASTQVFAVNRWVVIQVSDDGAGLTPEQRAILGMPFEQSADALRRGQEGLGIGWAFVRYVAEVHGGHTGVESPGRGKGSTFALFLPAAAEAA